MAESQSDVVPDFAKRRSLNYRKLKRVQEELVCAICLDFLEDPKLLHCGHSFCRRCLCDLVDFPAEGDDNQVRVGKVQCPACRESTTLLGGNVDALRTNFKLACVVEIISEEDRAEQRKALHDRMTTGSSPLCKLPVCIEHDRTQEYYCNECKELLCRTCMMTAHRRHDFDVAEIIISNRITSLRALIQPAWEAAAKAEELEKEIARHRDSLVDNSEDVKGRVQLFFEKARLQLAEREKAVLSAVDTHAGSRLDKLTACETTLQEDRWKIVDSVSEIDAIVERANDASVLPITHSIEETLKQHQASVRVISEAVLTESPSSTLSRLTFDSNQPTDVPITELGKITHQQNSVQSSREVFVSEAESSENEKWDTVNENSTNNGSSGEVEEGFSLTPQPESPEDKDAGLQDLVPSTSVNSMESVALPSGQVTPNSTPCHVSPKRDAHTLPLRRAKYAATRRRRITNSATDTDMPLLLEVNRRSLPEDGELRSPVPLTPVSSTGSDSSELAKQGWLYNELEPVMVYPEMPGAGILDFQPVGVAVGQGNAIIASDISRNVLKVIAASGRLIDTMGSDGKSRGQFRKPSAIAIDPEGSVFVADNGNHRIQKFLNGRFSNFWHKPKASTVGDFWGIAASGSGTIYATDWQGHCVHGFDKHGRHISTLGADFLKFPVGITVNDFGNLLVADRDHHCIWVLSPKGQMLKQIGHKGKGPGELNHPYGITVHPDGLILVTDSKNSRITIFSEIGEFLACFGQRGNEPGHFNHPKHICVNSRGQVVVADEQNHRIQVFDISPLISDIVSKQ